MLYSDIKKFATLTVAYNDEKHIGGMLDTFSEFYNLVLISKPWRGEHIKFDRTEEIARKMGAEVILKDFNSQKEQRQFGLDYLKELGYEYVLMIDTDEYFTKEDIEKIIKYVNENPADMYSIKTARVYWKSWKWHFKHSGGNICFKSDSKMFGKREVSKDDKILKLPGDIVFHHFSFERSLIDMLEKAETREYSRMSYSWLKKYWINWKPGDNYQDFIIEETKDIPPEILGIYIKSINMLYL